MSDEYAFRPSEHFRARLELDVLRRNRELSPGTLPSGGTTRPGTRVAVIAAIALILGATAGFASAQIGRNGQRDSLLAAARAEAMLADTQRDLARAEVGEAERKLQVGLIGFDTLYQVNAALADAERQSNRLAIDIEEITATGVSPRDDLNAPVANGRDFVKLRLEIDVVGTQARLRAAELIQRSTDARLKVGVASTVTSSAAALDVARVRAELAQLAQKLSLRKEFLEKGTPIEQLTQRLHTAQLQQDLGFLQQKLSVARDRLAFVERQRSTGAVGEVELLRARLEVLETELGLEQARARR